MTPSVYSTIEIAFLDSLIQQQEQTTIYLKNGIKLMGKITGQTETTIILDDPIPQIIYKHSISTVISC